MYPRLRFIPPIVIVGLACTTLITACTVWQTDSSYVQRGEKKGVPNIIDQTRTRDGVPYFLPKGMIHLVVKAGGEPVGFESAAPAPKAAAAAAIPAPAAAGGSAAGLDSDAAAHAALMGNLPAHAVAANPTSTDITIHWVDEKKPDPKPPKCPKGVDLQTYRIIAEVKNVPDKDEGVLYAHYATNWFFNDNTSLKTGKDGLLSATDATVEDRSPQIIDNLADTAINVFKFIESSGVSTLAGGSTQRFNLHNDAMMAQMRAADTPKPLTDEELKALLSEANEVLLQLVILNARYPAAPPELPYVKTLNVDERFDPLEQTGRENVQRLFGDDRAAHPAVFSPLRLTVTPTEVAHGKSSRDAGPRASGLWFREPVLVELVFTVNPVLLGTVRASLKTIAEAQPQFARDAVVLKALGVRARELLVKLEREAKERLGALAFERPTGHPRDNATVRLQPKRLTGSEVVTRLQSALEETEGTAADITNAQKLFAEQKTKFAAMLEGSHLGETAGLGRFTAVVPNKDRPFSMNIPRSAFVKRTVTMQIDQGMLTGVTQMKPSEIEGFSNIPLSLAKKLAGVPKALIDSRAETWQGSTAEINNQKANIDARKARDDAAAAAADAAAARTQKAQGTKTP